MNSIAEQIAEQMGFERTSREKFIEKVHTMEDEIEQLKARLIS